MTTTIGTTTTTTATMTPTPATSFNCTFSNKDCFDDPENITTIMNGSSYDEDMLNVTTVLPFPLSGANANRRFKIAKLIESVFYSFQDLLLVEMLDVSFHMTYI